MRRHAKALAIGSTRQHARDVGGIFSRPGFVGASSFLVASLLAMALVAAPANATKAHLFKETFGSVAQPTFSGEVVDLAIDQASGDLLVMNNAEGTIKRYNPDGTPAAFSALGTNVIDGQGSGDETPQGGLSFGGVNEAQIAIDESGGATDGDIYVTENSPAAIDVFSEAGAYLGQLTESSAGPFGRACGVAVDFAGDVYVGDAANGIHKFTPAANPPVTADNVANFSSTKEPCELVAGAGPTAGSLFFPVDFLGGGGIEKISAATGATEYNIPTGDGTTAMAVNPATGHVYSARSGVEEFDASGAVATEVSGSELAEQARGIAVRGSTGDIYAAVAGGHLNVEVLSGALKTLPGVEVEAPTSNTGTTATLAGAVNPDGEALTECKFEWGGVALPPGTFDHVSPCAETPAAIGTGTSPVPVHADISGLVPNGAGYRVRLIAANGNGTVTAPIPLILTTPDTVVTEAASAITTTTTTLNGSVDPDGVAISECFFEYGRTAAYGNTAPCVPNAAGIGTGTNPVPVHADLSGLDVGSAYHFRLVARYPGGKAAGGDQVVLTEGPQISAEWAQTVIRTQATLRAEINPRGLATTYRFEYGQSASYGQSTPELSVASDEATHQVGLFLEGLKPDTTYHYRAVATNSAGVNEGPDRTFTTYEPLTIDSSCPNRAYRIGPAATLPDCRAYEMVTPINKNGADIFTRSQIAGYDTSDDQAALNGDKIAYASYKPFGDALGSYYTNEFIASRGEGGWSSHGISPLHEGTVNKFRVDIGSTPPRYFAFSPDLSTGLLLDDGSPPLTANGLQGFYNLYLRDNLTDSYQALTTKLYGESYTGLLGPGLEGYSEDGKHTLFAAGAALTPEASPSNEAVQLYDYFDGEAHLVSVLPSGEAVPGRAGHPEENEQPYLEFQNVNHAISSDGSRIFWTSLDGRHVYARLDNQTTIPVSESVTSLPAAYQTASEDGSKVLFSFDPDNVPGSIGPARDDLYEFDVDSQTPSLIAHEVLGVLGGSNDLSYVYFVSKDDLAPGATAEKPNLYMDHNGAMTLVATLSGFDVGQVIEAYNTLAYTPLDRFFRVTPDGRHIAFQSNAALTAYDNTSSNIGKPAVEVYLYGADSNQLTCISCSPSGARPHTAPLHEPFRSKSFIYGGKESAFWAAWLPTSRRGTYSPRALADDGSRVFFNSFDPLVPEDTNGSQDVYEWEANGTGSCAKAEGCISMLSTGESQDDSEFIDANAGGRDVFIRTNASIDPRDTGLIDIYDVREEGGFPPPPPPPPPCLGDACQSVPEPQHDPTPASADFKGAGNPLTGKPRRSCQAHRRRAKQKHRRAKQKRAKSCKRAKRGTGR